MQQNKPNPRAHKATRYICPHCRVVAQQTHDERKVAPSGHLITVSVCQNCREYNLWINGDYIWPDIPDLPAPNPDLGEDIIADYNEAASIINKSPRGSAALLRLCVQKLCLMLGEPGKNLNSDIGALVKRGLSPTIQRALDSVRVIGNESVHPGELNLNDDAKTATALFSLVNVIAESLISIPKQAEAIYETLPESKRAEIDRRDS